MGFFKRFIINVTILVLFITFMPGLLPDVSITKSYKVGKIALDGILTPNKKLDKAEVLFKGDLLGPESFADDKTYLYTSLHTGEIVKITGKHIVPVVKFGKPCKEGFEERICGRPLGMRFGRDGYLYAVDTYYGIFKVDVNTGDKKKLISFGQEIDGKPARLPNSVAVSCTGDFYWTDSSSNFVLEDGLFVGFDDPIGRLIHYNAKTGENKVLAEGILFANGVALSRNEDFLVVSDAGNQILRHYLKGPKAGTTEKFLSLPGIPDNIQTDGKSGFIVSVIFESNTENPSLFHSFSRFPNVRRFLARSFGLAELTFRLVDKLYPNDFCKKVLHSIGHTAPLGKLFPSRSVILHVSEEGKVLDALWTNNSSIGSFSEAHIHKNYLYLGSPYNDYLGRIPLSAIGWDHLNHKSDSLTLKKELCSALYPDVKTHQPAKSGTPESTASTKSATQKPTTTTQKPTTTTQKPTTTTQKQTTANQKPTTTTQKPPTTTQKPPITTQKAAASHKPTTATKEPATATPKPATTTQKPTASHKQTTATKEPAAATPKPETRTQKSGSTAEKSRTQSKATVTPTSANTQNPKVVTESVKSQTTKEKPSTVGKEKNSQRKSQGETRTEKLVKNEL